MGRRDALALAARRSYSRLSATVPRLGGARLRPVSQVLNWNRRRSGSDVACDGAPSRLGSSCRFCASERSIKCETAGSMPHILCAFLQLGSQPKVRWEEPYHFSLADLCCSLARNALAAIWLCSSALPTVNKGRAYRVDGHAQLRKRKPLDDTLRSDIPHKVAKSWSVAQTAALMK